MLEEQVWPGVNTDYQQMCSTDALFAYHRHASGYADWRRGKGVSKQFPRCRQCIQMWSLDTLIAYTAYGVKTELICHQQ